MFFRKVYQLLLSKGESTLGFLDDLLGQVLGDASTASSTNVPRRDSFNGQRYTTRDVTLRHLYEKIYFDFGLTPPRNLKDGQNVPVSVWNFGSKVTSFEIHGNILSPTSFLERGWGSPFHRIDREIPIPSGRVWAFDTTRLHEGILAGSISYPSNEDYARSEEYLKILRTVGIAPVGVLHTVPEVKLDFGNIWSQYGIPDRIFVSLNSAYPLSEGQLRRVNELILHTYNRSDAPPVTADYSMDVTAGSITLVMRETNVQPAQQAPQAPTNAPQAAPANQADPDDGFPYDFYRGLGLINDDNTVTVPSMLGPVNADMRDPLVKQFLLEYKPEG